MINLVPHVQKFRAFQLFTVKSDFRGAFSSVINPYAFRAVHRIKYTYHFRRIVKRPGLTVRVVFFCERSVADIVFLDESLVCRQSKIIRSEKFRSNFLRPEAQRLRYLLLKS